MGIPEIFKYFNNFLIKKNENFVKLVKNVNEKLASCCLNKV